MKTRILKYIRQSSIYDSFRRDGSSWQSGEKTQKYSKLYANLHEFQKSKTFFLWLKSRKTPFDEKYRTVLSCYRLVGCLTVFHLVNT